MKMEEFKRLKKIIEAIFKKFPEARIDFNEWNERFQLKVEVYKNDLIKFIEEEK